MKKEGSISYLITIVLAQFYYLSSGDINNKI